jgi:alpha-methylacyl-CoA racemase
MMLADMGAEVIRVDRPEAVDVQADRNVELLHRGRRSLALDLKSQDGVALLLRLLDTADILFEPFRPGVMERLGLGPDLCLARNPRLVYGRMTGWGQDGPLAQRAGHDINYIALTGALGAMGGDTPTVPLNLVGDFGGGGMYLAFGLVCALWEARSSGRGQVVDAAMIDGASSLMTFFHGKLRGGEWSDERDANFLDGAAWFYDTYRTSDDLFISIGAIEREFRRELVAGLGLDPTALPKQWDKSTWPAVSAQVAAVVRTRTRDEWCAVFEGTDACVAPVLTLTEAPAHAHNRARGVFVEVDGVLQPAPAPRLSRTPGRIARPPARPGEDTDAILADWLGLSPEQTSVLQAAGVVRQASVGGPC